MIAIAWLSRKIKAISTINRREVNRMRETWRTRDTGETMTYVPSESRGHSRGCALFCPSPQLTLIRDNLSDFREIFIFSWMSAAITSFINMLMQKLFNTLIFFFFFWEIWRSYALWKNQRLRGIHALQVQGTRRSLFLHQRNQRTLLIYQGRFNCPLVISFDYLSQTLLLLWSFCVTLSVRNLGWVGFWSL